MSSHPSTPRDVEKLPEGRGVNLHSAETAETRGMSMSLTMSLTMRALSFPSWLNVVRQIRLLDGCAYSVEDRG